MIEAVISIGDKDHYVSYDSKTNDLRILQQKQIEPLKNDSFLAFTSSMFPIDSDKETQINFFFKDGIEQRIYKGQGFRIKDIVKYDDKIDDIYKFKSLIQLVTITSFKERYTNISFFSPDFTFTYLQKNENLDELAQKSRTIYIRNSNVRIHNYKFLKCYHDYILEKFQGLKPEKEIFDAAKYADLFEFIRKNIFIFSSVITFVIIINLLHFCGKKTKDDTDEKKKVITFYERMAKFMKKKERSKGQPKKTSAISTVPSSRPAIQPSAFSTVAGASVMTKTAIPRSTVFDSDINAASRKDNREIKVAGSGEYSYKKLPKFGSFSQSMNNNTVESGVNMKKTTLPFSEQFENTRITQMDSKSGKMSKASISDLIQKNIDMMKTTLQAKKN